MSLISLIQWHERLRPSEYIKRYPSRLPDVLSAMQMDRRKALIAKIDALSPEAQQRVEGYVDALREETDEEVGVNETEDISSQIRPEHKSAQQKNDADTPFFRWRGALRSLGDRFTAEELQEWANEWRTKNESPS